MLFRSMDASSLAEAGRVLRRAWRRLQPTKNRQESSAIRVSHALSPSHLSGPPRRKVPAFLIDSSPPPFKPVPPPAVGFSAFSTPAVFIRRHGPLSGQAQRVLCVEAIGPRETACRNNLHHCFAEGKQRVWTVVTPVPSGAEGERWKLLSATTEA